MLKKILTLSLVAVMLSVTAFADLSAIDAYAEVEDAAVTVVTTSVPEAIAVTDTSGTITLQDISEIKDQMFAPGPTAWIYMKYDISGFESLEEIKSAVLTLGIQFNNKANISVRLLDESVWTKAVTALESGEINSLDFTAPTGDAIATMYRAKGNAKLGSSTPYHFTDYAYNYYNEYYTSAGFKEWKPVNMKAGRMLETIGEAVRNDEDYLYLSVSSDAKANVGLQACKITASSDVQVIYSSVYNDGTFAPIYNWYKATEFGNLTGDFTYNVVVAPAGTKVRLLCGIYEGDALLGVVTSNVLTVGTDATSLNVPLSSYPTATKVKCFLWDGETLNPYTETPLENGAAITPAA